MQHFFNLEMNTAKGCRTSWSRQSGGTPQVVGSIPGRDEFPPAGKKKTPCLPHVQSTMEPGLTHKATGPRVRVGQGFGGFLGLL